VTGPTADALRRAFPAGTAPLVERVLAQAERRGLRVYLVGGPVRDLLLGQSLRDVDLLVEEAEGRGAAELAREAAPEGARVVAHERFGTVRIDAGGAGIDLATARSERYAHPGALPEVGPGRLDEDLRRRDFSVNAMALPLSEAARAAHGALVDLEEGRRDLERRTLRILHPRSFHDDPTRALRAARLAARLRFTLSRGTRSALRDALRDGAFGRVSGERLRRELEKLFGDAVLELDPATALRLLDEWHVLGALEPGLALPRPAVPALRRLGRSLAAPPWPSPRLRPWAAGLATWLAPLEGGLRTRALKRFAVRGEVAQRLASFRRLRDARIRALARARGRGAIDALLGDLGEDELLALHAWAPPTERRRIQRYAAEDRARRLPLTGDDLVALGLSGPLVGKALARIRSAFLDGAVRSRDDAVALARELGRRRPAPRRPTPAPREPGAV